MGGEHSALSCSPVTIKEIATMSRPGAVTFKGNPLTLAGEEVAADQPAPDFTLHYFDPETGTAETAHLRYVIYVPYATSESIGLSETPTAPGAPWLMNSGSYRAHIMIVPSGTDR